MRNPVLIFAVIVIALVAIFAGCSMNDKKGNLSSTTTTTQTTTNRAEERRPKRATP
jgi:outer membrane murein-binding lipoprotein Lpp